MLQSVLETDSRFGVVRWDPVTKAMSDVGCCAEIIKCQTAEDGRSNIITLVQQRFRVLELIREAPFVTAIVQLEEGPLMPTNIVMDDPTPEKLQIGMPLEVVFEHINEKIALPKFKPV